MQVGPTEAGKVARIVGTVVTQEQDSISDYVFVCVPDTDIIVSAGDIGVGVVLIPFRGVICE